MNIYYTNMSRIQDSFILPMYRTQKRCVLNSLNFIVNNKLQLLRNILIITIKSIIYLQTKIDANNEKLFETLSNRNEGC